jgi:beta-glucosidase
MVRAQNDLYMVCPDSSKNKHGDNLEEALADGRVTIAELQRCAKNICGQAMNMYAFERLNGNEAEIETADTDDSFKEEPLDVEFINGGMDYTYDLKEFADQKEIVFGIDFDTVGMCKVSITASSELGELAQLPVTFFFNGKVYAVYTFNGTGGKSVTIEKDIFIHTRHTIYKLFMPGAGLKLESIRINFNR